MWQSGSVYHVEPLRISLKGTIDTIEVYRPRLAEASMPALVFQDFLFTIAQDVLPDRRNRYDPRVLKRRKKPKFGYLMAPRSQYRQRLGL
jgi:hypothetical protein